jgi:hypothetical protein
LPLNLSTDWGVAQQATRNEFRELLVGRLGGLYGCRFNAWRVETEECLKKRENSQFSTKGFDGWTGSIRGAQIALERQIERFGNLI